MVVKDKSNFMNNIMDDIYHPDNPICQILPTSPHKKRDIFKQLRPQRGTCLDYTISQTDAKFDAGDTKIHFQQTIAEYVPSGKPPRARKKIKYFSGGPPKWFFVDEIWRKKMEQKQLMYHEGFKDRIKARKSEGKDEALKMHHNMLARVGPEWFQELSPQQLRTVDNLKNCIIRDLAEGSIACTTENIASLGLVLRPNHRWIEKALKNCCKCPIEFLLILYQLINPNRMTYSINDRLLLSAVVHLTMTDTLRELHVRIPSPPPPPKIKIKKIKKNKKVHYESPYLEPYTFERPPPKFTGIYRNKHRQYPESPYFSYLEEFRKSIKASEQQSKEAKGSPKSPPTLIVDLEIEEETEYAQKIYEQLVDFRPVPTLLKPSKYIECVNFRTKKAANEEIPDYDQILNYLRSFEQDEEEEEWEDVEEEVAKKMCICCTCHASQGCNPEEIEEATSQQTTQEEAKEEEAKEKEEDGEETLEIKCSCGDTELKKPSQLKRAVCECKKESRKFIDTPLCQCEKCVEERKNKTTTPVIAGMKEIEETEEKATIPIIDQVIAEQPCKCEKHYEKRVSEYEQYQKRKDLVYDTVKEENKFIIGGVINRPDGPVFMISDLLPKYECICNEMAREEEAERRHLARMPHAPPGRIQHGIQGVKETAEGNVFILDNTLPCEPCDCMKLYDAYEQEHENCLEIYERYMHQMEEEIGGFFHKKVSTTTQTRSYAITEDNKNEENMETVQLEENRIRLPPIVEEIVVRERKLEIIEEQAPRNPFRDIESEARCIQICGSKKQKKREPLCSGGQRNKSPRKQFQDTESEDGCIHLCGDKKQKKTEPSCFGEQRNKVPRNQFEDIESEDRCIHICGEEEKEPSETSCSCGQHKIIECNNCTCGQEIKLSCTDCTCGQSSVEEVVEEEEEKILKRFFIFKKILCDDEWQMNVIKAALQSMADDGFPLAKLPNAYKLPHFKLWMQLRCGVYWTLEDRYKSLLVSKGYYRHLDYCRFRPIRLPTLPLTKSKASLLTWSDAAYCRRLANDTITSFYRKIAQDQIDYGREYFPAFFTYPFPFRTFRDCVFAYTPAKEEDVLARFVWNQFEYKHMAEVKHCV